ncbi:MAG: toll/interleukin-1 receptor domain-containing protein [Verrucomicrobiota bacterium]
MGYEIFISYSSVDKVVANAVCSNLETAQFRCWIAPRDVQVGRPWAESIIKALNEVGIMVLIFSQHSNASKQVILEVERAVSKGISIVPVPHRQGEADRGARILPFRAALARRDRPAHAGPHQPAGHGGAQPRRAQPAAAVGIAAAGRGGDQNSSANSRRSRPDDWNRGASPNFIARMFRKLLEER